MENGSKLSVVKQALLEQRLKARAPAVVRPGEVPRRPGGQSAPVSFAQRQMWMIDQITPGNAAYNVPVAYRLRGNLDVIALERSVNEIVKRHEALRTTFAVEHGEPVQLVHPGLAVSVVVTELDHTPPEEREHAVRILASEESVKPFDLTRLPLIRVSLFRLAEADHVLLINVHHIVCDGVSVGLMLGELDELYRTFARGEDPQLPDLPVQYADFAVWERQRLTEADHSRQIDFWRQHLAGELPVLELPADKPRPARQSFNGANEFFDIPASLAESLRSLGASEGCTLFTTLLAAFQVLLHRYSGADDIVIGTPVAIRQRSELEPVIGNLLNMLPLRADLSGDPSFRELLRRGRKTVLDAFSNCELPFEVILNHLAVERDSSRNPVFQVAFQVLDSDDASLGDLEVTSFRFDHAAAPFDLSLLLYQEGAGYVGRIAYCTDLFRAETIGRLCTHYTTLLRAIADDPGLSISALPLLTEAERRRVLVEWNATDRDYPAASAIHQLFEAQVRRTPDAVAVECGRQQLTYAGLNARANQVARHLERHGVGPEVMVGICVERSLDMVVGILGILKAGGAYVPLDPDYPASRLGFMLEDTSAPVLLTQTTLRDRLPGYTGRTVCLDADWPEIALESDDDRDVALSARNLAYVIYTSGSTGQPKGTCIEHRSVVRLVKAANYVELGPDETFLQLAPLSFDASTFELWGCLLNGATLVVYPPGPLSLRELARVIHDSGVSTLWLTAALFHQMVDEQIDSLRGVRQLLAGGETLSVSHVQRMLDVIGEGRLINGYGPTENTTFTCCHLMTADSRIDQTVPIGRPISNTRIYVLDRHLRPVPIGVYGELYIGGDGLAREYLHQPELTAEKFVPDPFSGAPGARLYRSGDLVRFRPDGCLEFLGRSDNQVKIRGFRIEPGEIEATLDRHPLVRQSVVIVREEEPGWKQLVAYAVPEPGAAPEIAELRQYVRERLPHFMVPAAVVLLDALPVTPNGKIDRSALPAPTYERREDAHDFVRPQTETERALAAIWVEVLKVGHIAGADNFFDLGGHSLLAIRTMSRIRDVFGVELPTRALFESPTLAELAVAVTRARDSAALATRIVPRTQRGPCALSFSQERFWLLHQLAPASPVYNIVDVIRADGPYDREAMLRTLRELVRRHEILRTVFVPGDEQPMQLVLPTIDIELPEIDLRAAPEPHRDHEWSRVVREQGRTAFDLSRPLLRATVAHLTAADHRLLLVSHHIVADEWSMELIHQEVTHLYGAFRRGEQSPLAELPIQYADFACWQREWLQGDVRQRQLAFWREALAGAPSTLALPTDKPRPPVPSFRGATEAFSLPRPLLERLKALARRERATLFMVLEASFMALLHRMTGQDDILVGTPISGRTHSETERLLGCFINTVVLRAQFTGDSSFRALLQQVRERALAAYAHPDLPFEQLVAELAPERDPSRTPLFQTMFVLHNSDAVSEASKVSGNRQLETGTSKFDLSLVMAETDSGLEGVVEYSTDLFAAETIQRICGRYGLLLDSIARDPDQRIAVLPILSDAERQQLIGAWNDTAVPYPQRCLHTLIEDQALRSPDQPAVVFEQERLTYGQLDGRANRLARHLRQHGVGPDDRVALLIERSVDMIVGMLAILKAGGAYVPIDPASPSERIAFTLADAEVRVLLTHTALAAKLPIGDAPVVCMDAFDWTAASDAPITDVPVHPHHLAYVIYTSGSTGRPKGVCIEHRNIVNYVLGVADRLRLTPGLQHATVSTIAADLGNTVIFPALATGGCLHVIAQERAENPLRLAEYFERQPIDVLKIVPSHLAALQTNGRPEAVMPRQRLLLGGEASRREWVERLRALAPGCEIHNHYGPTETTVGVLTFRVGLDVPATPSGTLPIGRPLPNSQMFILDSHGQPVPVGVQGELYIGGCGVARGYLNRPELTRERFVANPFGQDADDRLYRTGDLARYLPDGSIEFRGRADDQVKVHGYRIELGEIEAALRGQRGVREAVVVARDDGAGTKQLVGYVVPRRATHALAGHAVQLLPDGSSVAHLNKNETTYIYNEIFVLQAYLRHGITIRDGDCIVDAGANIGLFTVFASRLARNLRILAFEPNPAAFACLQANADAWGSDVQCFQEGLSRATTSAQLTFFEGFSLLSGFYADAAVERELVKTYALNQAASDPDGAQVAARIDELLEDRFRAKTETARLRTLSGVIAEQRLSRIDLLKINVEKSELDVLQGIQAGDWSKIRQLVVEIDQRAHVEPITTLLDEQGYEFQVQQDPLLRNTELCYVYAIRPSAAGRLIREQARDAHLRPVPPVDDAIVTPTSVRAELAARLPQYMIPSAIVLLDSLPLTANGKINRNALPAPDRSNEPAEAFVAPRTPAESLLADIWSQVLRIERVGVRDRFLELGGDSILAIQVIARAGQAGLRLTVKQIFQHQTIAELAQVAERIPQFTAESAPVTGAVPLTPIQHWFFEQDFADPHHWNQAMVFELRQSLEPALLEHALRALLDHHDALRLRFTRHAEGWRQVHADAGADASLTHIDLSGLGTMDQDSAMQQATAGLHTQLDLSNGPLVRCALFDLGPRRRSRLLIVIHHLVVDAVSWRIVLEDLQTACDQLRSGAPVGLPAKTTSFQQWAQRLTKYARSRAFDREADQWLADTNGEPGSLPLDLNRGDNTEASARVVSVSLDAENTSALLQRVSDAYTTQINDVLVAALGLTLGRWTGQGAVTIDLEGHGREDLFDDIDLSRTVGWFTTLFPLRLDVRRLIGPEDALKYVKEQLRRVPRRGIGYGLARYLTDDENRASPLRARPQPRVLFNYLGQLDQLVPTASPLAWIEEPGGSLLHSPRARRSHVLDIDSWVADGRLKLDWRYSENLHLTRTIESLAHSFLEELRRLIAHCASPAARGYTPSDFADAGLSQAELDRLIAGLS